MEVSQITGAGKDPVARVEEDKKLKGIGAVPAVNPVKKDEDAKQSTPEQTEAPSFEHLRQEPLQLLLRAINARLLQSFGATNATRSFAPAVEQALTPEAVSARVLVSLGAAFERFKIQHTDTDPETVLAMFQHLAGELLQQSADESGDVLRNLNLLDSAVTSRIEKAVTLIQTALSHFGG
jgi:hypothetical protein